MARPFAAPTPSLPPCGVALVAVLHLLLSTLASSGAESYAMTWGDQAASGYGATAHARSGLDRWRPATVTVCTSEYRPFVFPREDYALVKYLIHKASRRNPRIPASPEHVTATKDPSAAICVSSFVAPQAPRGRSAEH